MNNNILKEFLEVKYRQYNQLQFITDDPISIPHLFSKREDIEIAGFITAMLAWGQRKTIIRKSRELLKMMDNVPHDYVINSNNNDLNCFAKFQHRTFSGIDCGYFIRALKNLYINHGGLGAVFEKYYFDLGNIKNALIQFREKFFFVTPCNRTYKHIPDVSRGSASKRLNMFLRWMVRKEGSVDFGLWEKIPSSALYIPLDTHTGNVSRKLGLLFRKQNDWKAVELLTDTLKKFDPDDPVKYDFALFGLGKYEDF